MSWTIRRAAIHDSQTLALVGSATFLETFAGYLDGSSIVTHCAIEHSVARYERFFASAALWLGEADDGKAPIAYAVLSKSELERDAGNPDTLELKRIYVLSRYHGLGLANELLAEIVAEARRRGAPELSLAVFGRNARAIRFYEKNGFIVSGDRRFYIGDREYDDVILSRPL